MIVVLPAPVCPTSASVRPGSTRKLTPLSTHSGDAIRSESRATWPRSYANHTSSNSTRTPRRLVAVAGPRRLLHRAEPDRLGLVEQPEHALARRHRLLERVELVRQILQRLEEPAHELEKRGDRSHGQRSDLDAMRPGDDQARQRDRREHLDHREVERVVGDRIEIRLQMAAIQIVEALRLRRLAPEHLHDAHAGDPLLEVRVDAREPRPDVAIRVAHLQPEQRATRGRRAESRRTTRAPAANRSTSIKPLIASSVNRSPSPATTPAVNSSLSDSTSDVTRVTSRPTGLRSKNVIDSRWT